MRVCFGCFKAKYMNKKRSSSLSIQLTMKTQQTRSMMMKTETIDLFSFLSKYAKRNFSLRHSSKKKQSCWYYTDKNSYSEVLIKINFVPLLSINSDCTTMQHKTENFTKT